MVKSRSQPHPRRIASAGFLPVGTWLSLVEHSLGVRGVGSSNLPVPTIQLAISTQPSAFGSFECRPTKQPKGQALRSNAEKESLRGVGGFGVSSNLPVPTIQLAISTQPSAFGSFECRPTKQPKGQALRSNAEKESLRGVGGFGVSSNLLVPTNTPASALSRQHSAFSRADLRPGLAHACKAPQSARPDQ